MIATVIILSGLKVFAQDYVPPPANQQQDYGSRTLLLINNSGHKISVAIAYYDIVNRCWASKGWYVLEREENKILNLSSMNIGGRTMYVHAQSVFKNWGAEISLCVNAVSAFTILQADIMSCNTRKQFDQVTIGQGQNSFTFNP